jgi:hypothetical protein
VIGGFARAVLRNRSTSILRAGAPVASDFAQRFARPATSVAFAATRHAPITGLHAGDQRVPAFESGVHTLALIRRTVESNPRTYSGRAMGLNRTNGFFQSESSVYATVIWLSARTDACGARLLRCISKRSTPICRRHHTPWVATWRQGKSVPLSQCWRVGVAGHCRPGHTGNTHHAPRDHFARRTPEDAHPGARANREPCGEHEAGRQRSFGTMDLCDGPRFSWKPCNCDVRAETKRSKAYREMWEWNGRNARRGEWRRVRLRSPARTEKKPSYVLSFDGEVGTGAKTLDGHWRAVFLLTESSEVRTGKFSAKRR